MALSLLLVVPRSEALTDPALKCAAAKLKASGRAAQAFLTCTAKATAKGLGVDPDCSDQVSTKLVQAFAKADVKAVKAGVPCGFVTAPLCVVSAEETFVGDVAKALHPVPGADTCAAEKLRALGKVVKGSLDAQAKNTLAPSAPTLDAALAKQAVKFTDAFAKAEARSTCSTTGDKDASQAQARALVSTLLPLAPVVTITQLDLRIDNAIVDDSAWGDVAVTAKRVCAADYFNLVVNGSWVVQNAPAAVTDSRGAPVTAHFYVDLGVAPGTDVPMLNYAYAFGSEPLATAPVGAKPIPVSSALLVRRSGIAGHPLQVGTPSTIVGVAPNTVRVRQDPRAALPNSASHDVNDFAESETPGAIDLPADACVPIAYSASLRFLHRSSCVGGDASFVAQAAEVAYPVPLFGGTFMPYAEAAKQSHDPSIGLTFSTSPPFYFETGGPAHFGEALAAIRNKCDVEINMEGHTASLVGITDLGAGRYTLELLNANNDGVYAVGYDPVTNELQYGPGVSPSKFKSFAFECPDPAYQGPCIHECAPRCLAGQRCQDGICIGDPCAAMTCPVGEQCRSGTCVPDPCATANCDDGNSCTIDGCSNGSCQHLALPCPAGWTCDPAVGICDPCATLQCDDGNICNGLETCDPLAGCQPGAALACGDGDPCNGEEACGPSMGCQAGSPVQCAADEVCAGVDSGIARCFPIFAYEENNQVIVHVSRRSDRLSSIGGVEGCFPDATCVNTDVCYVTGLDSTYNDYSLTNPRCNLGPPDCSSLDACEQKGLICNSEWVCQPSPSVSCATSAGAASGYATMATSSRVGTANGVIISQEFVNGLVVKDCAGPCPQQQIGDNAAMSSVLVTAGPGKAVRIKTHVGCYTYVDGSQPGDGVTMFSYLQSYLQADGGGPAILSDYVSPGAASCPSDRELEHIFPAPETGYHLLVLAGTELYLHGRADQTFPDCTSVVPYIEEAHTSVLVEASAE